MGEYFEEPKQRVETPQETKLIGNFNEVCSAYDILMEKIKIMSSEGYETILPIRQELSGTGSGPDDVGQIGHLRRKIQMSRIWRMDLGIEMFQALKNIEDLDKWSEKYIEYMEQFIDGLKVISKSCFKIISENHVKINNLNAEIAQLKSNILSGSQHVPDYKGQQQGGQGIYKSQQAPVKKEIKEMPDKEFRDNLIKRLETYENFVKQGDAKAAGLAKGRSMVLGQHNDARKEIIRNEIAAIDARHQKSKI
jgi:hypothetical protein